MKLEDMNFEPRKGIVISSIAMSVIFTLIFGAVAVVNVYRQFRDPTSTSDFWGWIGTAAVTFSCIALLLFFTTATYRIRYYEAGLILLGPGGRNFVPWSAVTHAQMNRFKGNIELALKTADRRIPISVPLNSYKKQVTLLAEIQKRLLVPVHDPGNSAAMLTDD